MLEFSESLKVFLGVCIGVLCIVFFIYIVRRKLKKETSCYDLNLSLTEIIDIKLQMKQEEEEGPISDELIEKLKKALEINYP